MFAAASFELPLGAYLAGFAGLAGLPGLLIAFVLWRRRKRNADGERRPMETKLLRPAGYGLIQRLLSLVRERMPSAVVFENVPSFGTSLAGQLVTTHLERLGYHVFTTVLKPNAEWNEIEDRQRWLLVATLDRPCELRVPGIANTIPVSAFLDPPDPIRDQVDAARIARTIEGLRAHNVRHHALGHGFGFTVLDGSETRLPVIPRSYHKINTGPFVQTPFGLRLLRLPELERIRGHAVGKADYATGVEILGQGVLTGSFRAILVQVGRFLTER
jgi:DNA (cytosine-5)-methyltransferase 1